jgi:hypothetical protein
LTSDEYQARLTIYLQNLKYIEEHNTQTGQVDYKLEVNAFSDWSVEERDALSLNSNLLESKGGEAIE